MIFQVFSLNVHFRANYWHFPFLVRFSFFFLYFSSIKEDYTLYSITAYKNFNLKFQLFIYTLLTNKIFLKFKKKITDTTLINDNI